ncbi:Uncharacterised protein [Mycobacteroides abscessus subsp. abscessus]|nr:Uncharacterised protein [Mycobacteroides abscessus subsp. abscessus]
MDPRFASTRRPLACAVHSWVCADRPLTVNRLVGSSTVIRVIGASWSATTNGTANTTESRPVWSGSQGKFAGARVTSHCGVNVSARSPSRAKRSASPYRARNVSGSSSHTCSCDHGYFGRSICGTTPCS